MAWRGTAAACTLCVAIVCGCTREELPPEENGGTGGDPMGPAYQRLTFLWSGLPSPSRTYFRLNARYNPFTRSTIIETTDDSLTSGKLYMRLSGGSPGTYSYTLRGNPSDLNEVFIRFVSSYEGTTPLGEFLLTGIPADSLYGEVIVTYYGPPGDSIVGRMMAILKQAGSTQKVTLYDGRFVVERRSDSGN